MQINDDFTKRVVVRPEDYNWVASPLPDVKRVMLDRIGGEVARATSFVNFAANSYFDAHTHGGGEEFLVLDGVFSDEYGDFGPGSYIRNPVGTHHKPHTDEGTTIFVKLWQFQPGDNQQVRIDTRSASFVPGLVDGLSVLPLHHFGTESTALVRWEPGTVFNRHRHWGGEEILVLDGTFADEHGTYPKGTWLRNPDGSEHLPFSNDGCLIFVKTGHLFS